MHMLIDSCAFRFLATELSTVVSFLKFMMANQNITLVTEIRYEECKRLWLKRVMLAFGFKHEPHFGKLKKCWLQCGPKLTLKSNLIQFKSSQSLTDAVALWSPSLLWEWQKLNKKVSIETTRTTTIRICTKSAEPIFFLFLFLRLISVPINRIVWDFFFFQRN